MLLAENGPMIARPTSALKVIDGEELKIIGGDELEVIELCRPQFSGFPKLEAKRSRPNCHPFSLRLASAKLVRRFL